MELQIDTLRKSIISNNLEEFKNLLLVDSNLKFFCENNSSDSQVILYLLIEYERFKMIKFIIER